MGTERQLPQTQDMNSSLEGQVVAITGAARGIGLETARAFVARGASVAVSDIDAEALGVAAEKCGAHFRAPLDVTDGTAFGEFLAAAESALGPLDVLVNNAGIMPTGPLLDEPDQLARKTFECNVLGTLHGTKRALALMVPRGYGHVVNIASTMGEAPVPGLSTYNASKAASIMLTDAARLEFRRTGVHLSAILPGGVNTELLSGLDSSLSIPVPLLGRSIPLVRHVNAEDVARVVVRAVESGRSHARIYVPGTFGAILKSSQFLPRRASEALNRALGSERKVLSEIDARTRHDYLERINS